MKNRLEKILIDCLSNTLSIMICTERNASVQATRSLLSKYPLFNIFLCDTPEKVREILPQIASWQCIVTNNHNCKADELIQPIKSITSWTPLLLVGDCFNEHDTTTTNLFLDNQSTAEVAILQQKAAHITSLNNHLSPRIIRNLKQLYNALRKEAIQKKLFPLSDPCTCNDVALNSLFDINPHSVEEWTGSLNITSRRLTRALDGCTLYTPKKLVVLYQAYKTAFDILDHDCAVQNTRAIPAFVIEDKTHIRMMEYFLTRRSEFLYA